MICKSELQGDGWNWESIELFNMMSDAASWGEGKKSTGWAANWGRRGLT